MSEKYNESNPSIEQKPSRRQFIKRMFETGTTLIAGSIAGSEKLAGQDHPEKYYEGLDQNVVNEMKAVDKLTGDVKKADEIKQSKIKELLELWGQKNKNQQAISKAYVEYEKANKYYIDLVMQHANLAADIERAYRNKLPLIQKQALDAWYNAARRFNRYQTSGNSKEFNILLEKIEKFTKKK